MRNEGTKAEGSEKGQKGKGKREKGKRLKRRNEISNEVVLSVSKPLSDAFQYFHRADGAG